METGKGGAYRYYNCSTYTRRGKSSCEGNRVPQGELEQEVLKLARELNGHIDTITKNLDPADPDVARLKGRRHMRLNDLDQLEDRIRQIDRA